MFQIKRLKDGKHFATKAFAKKGAKPELIKNEAELMLRVRGHRRFVEYEGLYETANSVYMVMELIEGAPVLDLDDLTCLR